VINSEARVQVASLSYLLEALGQLLVCRLQLLAVAAPGCIHLQQHVTLVIKHNGVHSLANNNGDVTVLVVLRDRSGLVLDLY
jgi:hypothetical protein